mmetsp:Transcript_17611/g.48828  ORF Transcript_17611/g.48828 Transcript_17611/m.48828 type:complete len:161 (-) Transcript_17611:2022-2504(-)
MRLPVADMVDSLLQSVVKVLATSDPVKLTSKDTASAAKATPPPTEAASKETSTEVETTSSPTPVPTKGQLFYISLAMDKGDCTALCTALSSILPEKYSQRIMEALPSRAYHVTLWFKRNFGYNAQPPLELVSEDQNTHLVEVCEANDELEMMITMRPISF